MRDEDSTQSAEVSAEKRLSMETLVMAQTLRLSPRHNGSNLFDSFELQAVTRQLNKAMQGSSRSSPTYYLNYINSPLYRQHLDRIYGENANTPKRIMCSVMTGKVSMRGTRPASGGFVTKLWKKVKEGLLKNKP